MRRPTLVVAAATENNDYSKDYDPGAVIVKEIAKAVVIHKVCSSGFDVWRLFSAHSHTMREMRRVLHHCPFGGHFYEKSNATSPPFITSLAENCLPFFEIKP